MSAPHTPETAALPADHEARQRPASVHVTSHEPEPAHVHEDLADDPRLHPGELRQAMSELRRRQRNRALVCLLALTMVVAGLWYYRHAQNAEQAAYGLLQRELTYVGRGVSARDTKHWPLVAVHYFAKAAELSRDPFRLANWHLAIDLLNRARLSVVIQHQGPITGAAFNLDASRVLSVGDDNHTRLWDAATGEPVVEPLPPEAPVVDAADVGRLLAFTGDISDESLLSKYLGSFDGVTSSPDGRRILTWNRDGTVRLWDCPPTAHTILDMTEHTMRGTLVFSQDDSHVFMANTQSMRKSIQVWDGTTGQSISKLELSPREIVQDAMFSPDGRRILTFSYGLGNVRVWDTATGTPISQVLQDPVLNKLAIRGAMFSPDGSRILTFGDDKSVRLWDVATGTPVSEPSLHEGRVWGATFSRDGHRVLSFGEDKTARLWDAATGAPVFEPLRHDHQVLGAIFNQDESRILTWSHDHTARLWDAATGEPVTPPLRHRQTVRGAMFSQDGSRILTFSEDHTARIWDAATGKSVSRPMSHGSGLKGAMFSPDERRVLTYGKQIQVWDAFTGEPVFEPWQFWYGIEGALFSRDGSRILTWGRGPIGQGGAYLWDAATGKPISELMQHDANFVHPKDGTWRHEIKILGAKFSQDESSIMTWGSDGAVRVWPLPSVHPWPQDRLELRVQVHTGTRLDEWDQPQMIAPDEWHQLKAEYDLIRAGISAEPAASD